MFVPVWAILIVLSVVGVVTWWGVLRLIHSNDITNEELNKNLDCIDKNLSMINERLGRLETWIDGHAGQDNILFQAVTKEHESIWHAIDKIRGT